MGGNQSKTEITQLSQTLNDVIVSTMQSCEDNVTQSQSINETNSGIWFWSVSRLEQQSDIKSSCFSDVNKQLELQNNIFNAIAQESSTKGIALLSAFDDGKASAEQNLKNIIQNNVTMSNIQKSYNEVKQTQTATFTNSGIIGYRQQDLVQGSKLFAAATLSEMSKAGIFDKIESKLSQTANTTSENPLEVFSRIIGSVTSGIASGITSTMLFFGMIIVCIILLFRFVFSGDTSDYFPEQQPGDELPLDEEKNNADVMPTGNIEPAEQVASTQPVTV